MAQESFENPSVHFNSVAIEDTTPISSTILSENDKNDISFFFSSKTSDDTSTSSIQSNSDYPVLKSETLFIKNIQNQIFQLTKSVTFEELNTKLNTILIDNFMELIKECYEQATCEIKESLENQQQLQTSLEKKIKGEKFNHMTIFAQISDDTVSKTQTETTDDQQSEKQKKTQQLSYFAIQSLLSMMLILIKSAEKHDPIIIHQILELTNQLCEQIPMRSLSSSNDSNLLFKSMKPLTNYINELSLSTDPTIAKQAIKILLSYSIAKASFKDILSLVFKLIFDTVNVYDARILFIQLNNDLTEGNHHLDDNSKSDNDESDPTVTKEVTDKPSSTSLDYLKSIGIYPNSKLMKLDENLFTGQFISSIILSHIDLDNDIHSDQQFKQGSLDSSFSFEFHSDTFKQLFTIIEHLTTTQQSNTIIIHIQTVCLKLITTHFKFLYSIKSNLDQDILLKNDEIKQIVQHSSSESNKTIDLTTFVTNDELLKWFELLLKLTSNKNQIICQESSKALIYLLNQKTSSFIEKLSFIHKHILENQYPILIKQLLNEINKKQTILTWIEILCDNKSNESDKTLAFKILYSFIDIYFNLSNQINNDEIQKLFSSFQKLLLHRLSKRFDNNKNNKQTISSLISQYMTYILKKCIHQKIFLNNLLNLLLIGLYSMTNIDTNYDFISIQPIFSTILPLLTEYLLQHTTNEENINNNRCFISWLLGKMSYTMLSKFSFESFKTEYIDKLELPIFAGGCETQTIETNEYLLNLFNSNLALYTQFSLTKQTENSSSDKEFLMSIYNNTGDGAKLISKMKIFTKTKRLLQKSIEQYVNNSCAAIFAVYIKHFRRINLAKYELSQSEQIKPHNQLLTIYDYANNVQNLFSTIKAQGGDCDKRYEQIKTYALFLLISVKESDFIPLIEENLPKILLEIPQKKEPTFKRQVSRWSKARHVIGLLRNLMKACIRFKKLMLAKKRALEQKYDYESNLNRTIDTFIYGNFSSNTNEEKQLELDELNKCLCQQYQRAITRFITYQFSQKFIQNVCNLNDQNQVKTILTFYLPHLRGTDGRMVIFRKY